MDSASIQLTINLAMAGSAVIAVLALVLLVAGILKIRRKAVEAKDRMTEAESLVRGEDLEGSVADQVAQAFSASESEALRGFGEQMAALSVNHYEGRLLPDPAPVLKTRDLFQPATAHWTGRFFALISLSAGVLWLILALFIFLWAGQPVRLIPPALATFLLTALCGLFLLWYSGRSTRQIEREGDRFVELLAGRFPIFTDRAGVALLVSEMIGYGEKIRSEVNAFSGLAAELAKGEFAEGINQSVRTIMSQEVVPVLNESNYALTDLARSLAGKQEQGMASLADSFSDAVARALAIHLSPLPDKLQTLYQVAEHSADMMQESATTMERAREEGLAVTRDVQETLRLMALAKNDIADEMAAISDNLEILGASTEKMTALYAGAETNLATHIDRLTDQLRAHSDRLGEGILESAKSIEASVKMSSAQNKNAAILLERLDEQLNTLEALGRQITDNTIHFTKESGGFVSKTLEEFDVSLAEVVERLTFTTAEIRDAIDALPAVIRGGGGQ